MKIGVTYSMAYGRSGRIRAHCPALQLQTPCHSQTIDTNTLKVAPTPACRAVANKAQGGGGAVRAALGEGMDRGLPCTSRANGLSISTPEHPSSLCLGTEPLNTALIHCLHTHTMPKHCVSRLRGVGMGCLYASGWTPAPPPPPWRRPAREKGASKGPYAPPSNTGHHRQPNNNSLLC